MGGCRGRVKWLSRCGLKLVVACTSSQTAWSDDSRCTTCLQNSIGKWFTKERRAYSLMYSLSNSTSDWVSSTLNMFQGHSSQPFCSSRHVSMYSSKAANSSSMAERTLSFSTTCWNETNGSQGLWCSGKRWGTFWECVCHRWCNASTHLSAPHTGGKGWFTESVNCKQIVSKWKKTNPITCPAIVDQIYNLLSRFTCCLLSPANCGHVHSLLGGFTD